MIRSRLSTLERRPVANPSNRVERGAPRIAQHPDDARLKARLTLAWVAATLAACSTPAPSGFDASIDAAGRDAGPHHVTVSAAEAWQSDIYPGCPYASPIRARSNERDVILTVDDQGTVRALDPDDGATVWELVIEPDTAGSQVEVLATPGLILDGHAAILGWQEREGSTRTHTRLAVVDLDTHAFHVDFAPFDLAATFPAHDGGEVTYRAAFQLLRSAIVVRPVPDRTLGLAYVSVGNGPSVQPFHGWLFELDLDAWRRGEDAVDAVFTTTAENDCGPDNNRMPNLCGGGIWNAAGVQIVEEDGGDYTILAATGNGRIDFDRNAYAYSLLRLRRGLAFERTCDEALCADFDDDDAPVDCLASCRDIFVAHLPPGETIDPEDGTCDGLSFTACLHALDGDLGASMPVVVQPAGGPRVVVQPGKDGGLYLIDYDHLGTLYERRQQVDFCGTADDACGAFWMGMFITQPATTVIDGDPWVIVVSTMNDHTHPSGVHALRVVMRDGQPRFEPMWQVPDPSTADAVDSFRVSGGRPLLVDIDGEPFVFVVEQRVANAGDLGAFPGALHGIRVRDGEVMFRTRIQDVGQRFVLPLYEDGRLFFNTCARGGGGGRVLGYDIARGG